jgi:hypothetical protein
MRTSREQDTARHHTFPHCRQSSMVKPDYTELVLIWNGQESVELHRLGLARWTGQRWIGSWDSAPLEHEPEWWEPLEVPSGGGCW